MVYVIIYSNVLLDSGNGLFGAKYIIITIIWTWTTSVIISYFATGDTFIVQLQTNKEWPNQHGFEAWAWVSNYMIASNKNGM